MPMRVLAAIGLAVAVSPACAKQVPRPPGLPPGTPYVSWVIMSGDRDNPDREFVCQSDPRNDCVIAASRPDEQAFSDVHFYYHAAAADTKYDGTVTIGFFEGSSTARTVLTSVVVKLAESITNQSVSGIVTSTPGTYDVTFALTAAAGDGATSQPIRQSVQVVVK